MSVAGQRRALRPPSSRWSDLWNAPLHDFPLREYILYQYQPLSPELDVLEVGPGAGFTAFHMVREARTVTLLDVPEALPRLALRLRGAGNLRLVGADLSVPWKSVPFEDRFDLVFGLDVFEYVNEPATCLRNLAGLLRPGGELFLSYPNIPPPAGDGVNYFSRIEDLVDMIESAGFCRWDIFAVRPRPWAAAAYTLLHEYPLRVYRRLRKGQAAVRPQTYDSTWAFQNELRLQRYRSAPHLYWAALGLALCAGGDLFQQKPVTNHVILSQQLVIRAWR